MLNFRLLRPSILIDINRLVAELAYIRDEGAMIRIGALTRHREARNLGADRTPSSRAAIGGAACRASCDPQPRHPRRKPVACRSCRRVADDGASAGCDDRDRVSCRPPDPRGRRLLPWRADDRASVRTTSSSRSRFRRWRQGTGWAFEEVSRRAGDFALASVAVTLTRRLDVDRWRPHRHDGRWRDADARGRGGATARRTALVRSRSGRCRRGDP